MTRLEKITLWLLGPLQPEIDSRIFRTRSQQWPILLRMANWKKSDPLDNSFPAMLRVINMVLDWRGARLKSQGNRPFPLPFDEEMIRRAEEQLRKANEPATIAK